MTGTSNIYVSVTGSAPNASGTGIENPKHSWMISVEPHHFHIPGTQQKHEEPTHFTATWDEKDGRHNVHLHQIDNEPGIIGNILIAESAKVSTDKFHQFLEEELASSTGGSPDAPENWIKGALRALQKHKVADEFNIDEFMTWAHAYEADRARGEGQALVAYPKAHKDHESKGSKHKFWVSYPPKQRVKHNEEGNPSKYGGLM